jgi:hypothetical protein
MLYASKAILFQQALIKKLRQTSNHPGPPIIGGLLWRLVGILSTRFDGWLFLQRGHMRSQLTQSRLGYPRLREQHVLRFSRILQEVVDTRHFVVEGLAEDVLLLLQVHLFNNIV